MTASPGPRIDPDIARRIRLITLDVDGVLTDGSIWVQWSDGDEGGELRRFHVLDGLAIHLARAVGLEVAFVSGKRSPAVEARARELEIREVHLGYAFGKVSAIDEILSRRGWEWREVAHLADDLADLPALGRAGLPAAVANAVPEVREAASWRGSVAGGQGAVREFVEALLRARDEWDEVVGHYLERAGGSDGG